MAYSGIPDLYIIKGKLVFRKHIRLNGISVNMWKTIGDPENFTQEELRKIVIRLRNEAHEKAINKNKEFYHKSISEKARTNEKKKTEKEKTSSTLCLGELINKMLNWYNINRKKSTFIRNEVSAKYLIKFFGKDFPVSEITPGKIEEYKIWRKKHGVTDVTINKELRFLSTMINKAVEFEWIPGHKLYRRSILIKGIKNERIRYLTPEEEKRLFDVLSRNQNGYLKDMIILALNTGMRLGEILGLKWENVKFDENMIVLFPDQTKNKKKHIIPMNSPARKALENRLKEKLPDCPYVFHLKGKKIGSVKKAFKNTLKKAGIEDFRFHDLRHTFASRLVQSGVELYVVKELLNHSSITVTQKYAHLRLENMIKAVKILENGSDSGK